MKIKARRILEEMRKEAKDNDRERVSLYLSRSIFENFKIACEDIAPSKVLERVMREFFENTGAA